MSDTIMYMQFLLDNKIVTIVAEGTPNTVFLNNEITRVSWLTADGRDVLIGYVDSESAALFLIASLREEEMDVLQEMGGEFHMQPLTGSDMYKARSKIQKAIKKAKRPPLLFDAPSFYNSIHIECEHDVADSPVAECNDNQIRIPLNIIMPNDTSSQNQ